LAGESGNVCIPYTHTHTDTHRHTNTYAHVQPLRFLHAYTERERERDEKISSPLLCRVFCTNKPYVYLLVSTNEPSN